MKKPTKPGQPGPTLNMTNCTISGNDSAAITALAKAVEANAEAIKAIAVRLQNSTALIQVGVASPSEIKVEGKDV